MPKHLEGVRAVPEDFHNGRRVSLHPDSRRRRTDITKERTEDELDLLARVDRAFGKPVRFVSATERGSCHPPTLIGLETS